jgi:methylated-DNA-[protein]-cysteine S-methyltransferase
MTISSNHRYPEVTVEAPVSSALDVADDPCEIVEEAIPAMVIGDLSETDVHAIDKHCVTCRSCAETRSTWETGLAEPILPPDYGPPEPAKVLGLHKGHYGLMESPVGDLLIVVTDDGVADISYLASRDREERFAELEERGILATERSALVEPVREQLREYFTRHRSTFSLPVDLYGVTPFTRSVLEATSEVPFGHVKTYQNIAIKIGKPGASRAVGNALGRNPVPVIVPCHRVVRADGSMGWYTGGAHIKQALLDIEGVSFPVKGGDQPGLPGLS